MNFQLSFPQIKTCPLQWWEKRGVYATHSCSKAVQCHFSMSNSGNSFLWIVVFIWLISVKHPQDFFEFHLRNWISLRSSLYDLQVIGASIFVFVDFLVWEFWVHNLCKETWPSAVELSLWPVGLEDVYVKGMEAKEGKGGSLFSVFTDNSRRESKFWQETALGVKLPLSFA